MTEHWVRIAIPTVMVRRLRDGQETMADMAYLRTLAKEAMDAGPAVTNS